jgi:signal transduction histidine kinase
MQGAGTLRLAAERANVPPDRPTFRSDSFDSRLPLAKLSVADSGPGIPPETLKNLFSPYFTTKEGGTGLGLAIVSQLAAHYGGAIEVASEMGKGTTFSVYLPIAA